MNNPQSNINILTSCKEISTALKEVPSYLDSDFKKLVDRSISFIIFTNTQGNILFANKLAIKVLGLSLPKLKAINWQDLVSCPNYKFYEKINHWRYDNKLAATSGTNLLVDEKFNYEYNVSVLKDNEGNRLNLILLQHSDEVNIMHSELSLLTNNSEEGFLILDKNLNIVSFNRESENLFQKILKAPLIRGASIFKYAKPERLETLTQLYARVLKGGSESSKACYNDTNGAGHSFIIKYQPAQDDDGKILGVFISFKNISKEEEHLTALEETQERLKKIMDSSLDIICTVNKDGIYTQVSAAVERIWGYKTEEVVGKHYSNFVMDDFIPPTVNIEKMVKAGKAISNFENYIKNKNGNIISMQWSANWDNKAELMFCVGRDITAKKQAEIKVEQSEQRFKSLVQDGADLVAIMNEEANYSYVSPTCYGILGYTPEFLVGKNAFDFIHHDDMSRVRMDFESIAYKPKLFIEAFRFKDSKGEWRWVESSLTNLLNEPMVNGFVVNSRDITERVNAEANLKFSAKLLDTIGQAAIATDLSGIISYWNKAAETIYGYSKNEALGKHIMEITPAPDSLDKSQAIMNKISKGQPWSGEFLVRKKDGTVFPAAITNSPILNQEGNVTGIIGISSDITERKIAERNLELANERHNLILKATNEVVWDWDLETGIVIRSAENMKKLFGYNVKDDINNANFWHSILHPDEEAATKSILDNFIQNSKDNHVDLEYRIKRADGSFAHVHDRAFAIRNKNGKAIRMIGSVKDVSSIKEEEIKLKNINEELVKQAKELAFSNKELEQFAYVASHDLQEPLRMVSSFLTQIEKKYEPLLDEKGKRYIHFAVDGAKRMRQIILDLLEYSRAGNKEDQREEVNLNNIIKEVTVLLRKKIEEKQAVITYDDMPFIKAHIAPMRQVIQNLISNALIYNKELEPPHIHISVKDFESHWQFEFKDNGIGISSNHFEKVFLIFQRLHRKENCEGTGVGLAVTKKIIENYGGNIWLQSTPDEGTSFFFTFYKEKD